MPHLSEAGIHSFMATPQPELGGKTPEEALDDGMFEPVLLAAKRNAAQLSQ
jgi:hypothetical protein